ncbi:MAG: glutathione S-transferase N-terminal domain-containing protein, partial [Pseudomonadota bacterium]
MIELYFWPTPNGWKISIALQEMGLPHNVNLIDIGNGDQFKPNFLKISPNNRMPAIVDPDGPDDTPISIFESGAILQYLARKTGQFYGETERDRIVVDQWLMWQMGGLGPMAGQNHHFNKYAPDMGEDLTYAKDRYTGETARLYRVLNTQLEHNAYVAGDFFSIADMAIWPWASLWEGQKQTLDDKPHMKRW